MLKKPTQEKPAPDNVSAADRITSLRKGADAARPRPVDTDRPAGGSRRQLVRWGLIGLGPLVVLVAAAWFYVTSGQYVSTDDAFVKTDIVSINAQMPGQVTAVYVQNNQSVTAGQLLFEIDPQSYRIAVDQAEANLANVKSQIAALRANYLEKSAMLKNAQETVDFQQREYNRQVKLRSSGVASEQKVDEARRAYENAQRQMDVVREQMAAIEAQLGGDVNKPTEDLAIYRAALARRDDAELALSRTKVFAPAAGVVANVNLRPGDYVNTGQPVFSLAELGHTWIEANFKETELTHVLAGQPATVTVDSYPDVTWTAHVESLSPASGNEFSLLPAQNSSGNWVKVVQRIPIRLAIDPQPGAPQLRAGMSVVVDVDTGPHHAAWLTKLEKLL